VHVPTKSEQITLRVERGTLKKLSKAAAREGLRRAAWARKLLLERASRALDATNILVPLVPTTAHGKGEGLCIRLSAEELKRVHRACKKEGMILSAYVRAICTQALEVSDRAAGGR
jgi:predicted DNA binding CopG/RHH family protein